MTRDELKRLIQGPIATVPTPFDDQMKIDFGRMAELTRWWVDSGLVKGRAVIKVAAAAGEGPDLSDDEWPHLLRTVVNAADGKAAIVCGLKTKNTLHTIEDARKAADLGAIGLQIDLPIFHHPTQDDLVRYFTDISDAIDIGILIYNTFWFGAESIKKETMLRLTDAEHVVGIKWATPPDQDFDDMREFAHIFNVIDNSGQWVRSHKNGGRGFTNLTLAVYPPYELGIWDLLEARRYDEAQAEMDRVYQPLRAFQKGVAREARGYWPWKALMAVTGRPVGRTRPPSLMPLNEEEWDQLRELVASFGWPVSPAPVRM